MSVQFELPLENPSSVYMDGTSVYPLRIKDRPGVVSFLRMTPNHAQMVSETLAEAGRFTCEQEKAARLEMLESVIGWISALEFEGDEDLARAVIVDLLERIKASGAL